MTFRQRVAAIKREARKRRPRDVVGETLSEITRRVFLPKLFEMVSHPTLLGVMIEGDLRGGVWRNGNFAPLKPHEIAERSRQYAAMRNLEGPR